MTETETQETIHCFHCSEPITDGSETMIGDEPVCGDCLDENYFTCFCCEELTPNDDGHETYGEQTVCESCCTHHYCECRECERVVHCDDAIEFGCDIICPTCYDSDYGRCSSCDEIYRRDDGCDCCEEEEEEEKLPIHSYAYRPYFTPLGNAPILGIELEMETTGNHDETVNSVYQLTREWAYLKHDGSLSESGFEVVTHPLGYELQRKRWTKFLADRPKSLKSWGTERCGLHVHVSREGLSKLQIGKIVVFCNHWRNAALVAAISGRTNDQMQKWSKIKPDKMLSSGGKPSWDRFEAVNLCPQETIEFRLFRGSLGPRSFFRSLEFVHALLEFSRPAHRSTRDFEWMDPFVKFISDNKKEYKNLYETTKRFEG